MILETLYGICLVVGIVVCAAVVGIFAFLFGFAALAQAAGAWERFRGRE